MNLSINSIIVDRGTAALSQLVADEDEHVIREAVYAVLLAALEPDEDDDDIHRAFYDLAIMERDQARREAERLRQRPTVIECPECHSEVDVREARGL